MSRIRPGGGTARGTRIEKRVSERSRRGDNAQVDRRRLGIYLNDHLAGAALGTELARRAHRENAGRPVGDFLGWLAAQILEDRAQLERLMRSLGIPESRLKKTAAIVAERLGRLKLNGQLTGYSPLSRVIELDGLTVGVRGKRALWEALEPLTDAIPALRELDYAELKRRADEQLAGLERERAAAAREAFDVPGDG
jgi:hypothetical protein